MHATRRLLVALLPVLTVGCTMAPRPDVPAAVAAVDRARVFGHVVACVRSGRATMLHRARVDWEAGLAA
jgi:hypothetical protein